jgi:hypothetical protein
VGPAVLANPSVRRRTRFDIECSAWIQFPGPGGPQGRSPMKRTVPAVVLAILALTVLINAQAKPPAKFADYGK